MSEIRSVSVHLDADVAGYIAKMRLAGAETDKAFGTSTSRSIDTTNSKLANTESTLSRVDTQARRVESSMSRVGTTTRRVGDNDFSRATSKVDGFIGKLGLIPALAVAGSAALVPLAAAATGVAAAFAAPIAFVGGGVTLFALLGGAAISETNKQYKAIDALELKLSGLTKGTKDYVAVQKQLQAAQKAISPQQREFHNSLETLQSDFAKFIRGPAGQDLLAPFTQGLQVADDILPHLTPVISAVSGSLTDLLGELDKYTQTPGFDRFVHQVSAQIGPDLKTFGHIIGDIGPGIGDLLLVLGKHLSPDLMREVRQLAAGFSDWASSRGAREDVKSFIRYFHEVGPQVADTIGAVARGLGHIVEALAPLGPPVLHVVEGIADAISGIPVPVLTALAGAAAGLVVLQKTGGLKALSFGAKLLGGSSTTGGGVAGSVLGGGVQKVFVVNMPGGGLGPGGPDVVGGGGKSLLGKAGILGLGAAAIGALDAGGTKVLMGEYGKTLGGAVAASLRGVLSLPDPALESAGVHVGTSILHGITSTVSGGLPGVFHKVFGGGDEATKSIKSVGTAVESLEAQAGRASRQIELIGPHAQNASGTAVRAIGSLQDKLNRVKGAKAEQSLELFGTTAQRSFSQAGAGADQLQGHINAIHGKKVDVTVNGGQSLSVLRQISADLNALHDKTIQLTTERTTGGRSFSNAAGGTVPGQRSPYGDKVLRFLAPGEEVISNRYGQADRHRGLLKRINAGRGGAGFGMADGGTVTTTGDPAHLHPFAQAIDGATGNLHDLNKELAAETRAVAKERQQRDALVAARQQLVSTVSTNFRSDLFGVSGAPSGVWAKGASDFEDPTKILHQDIRDAREYRDDIRRLRHRGLSRAALTQVTTLEAANQLEDDSRRELRNFSRLYGIRQRASQAAGATLGDIRYSKQIAESNQHLKHLRDAVHHTNQEIKETNHRLAELHKEQQKAAQKTGDAVGNQINKAASVAVRRRRGDKP